MSPDYSGMNGVFRPIGDVYCQMVPPHDSFEAAHPENWFPLWYRVVGHLGYAKRIEESEAKAHFESLGLPMPEPEW